MKLTDTAIEIAKKVKLLILDVDGVLTDGGIYFDDSGNEFKRFNSLDGHGIKMLLDSGIEVGVISARSTPQLLTG
jgi:3-deoxy-D-manno-octulosonate 8-phosphate phosphatase (KDO 8-P phosphatase)